MAAKSVRWAPRARADLLEIWHYFTRVGSAELADGILFDIDRVANRLKRHPLTGRARNELVPGLPSVLVHPHVIFYRVSNEAVEITRVLHQRRDLAAIFSRESDPSGHP